MTRQNTFSSGYFSDTDEQEYMRLADQVENDHFPQSEFSDVDESKYVKLAEKVERAYQHEKQENKDMEKYRCDECGKAFRQKYTLNRHKLSHTFRVSCPICQRQFRRKDFLTRHMKNVHGVFPNKPGSSTHPHDEIEGEHPPPQPESSTTETKSRKISVRRAINNQAEILTLHPEGLEQYDLISFLANIRASLREQLLGYVRQRGIKWYVCVQLELERRNGEGNLDTSRPHFRSRTYILLNRDTFTEHELNEAIQKIVQSLEQYLSDGSGWVVKKILQMELYTVTYSPLSATSYLPLPKSLQQTHSLLNIRNIDEKCFTWSILSAIHPQPLQPEKVEQYQQYEHELDMSTIDYPVHIAKLDVFESKNKTISINVFAYEQREIYPLRITKQRQRQHHINLLYLSEEGKSHYCLIKDLNRFLARTKSQQSKTWFCWYCLSGFTQERLLDNHLPYCEKNGAQKVNLPKPGEHILEFKDFEKTLSVPFVIYADFECLNKICDKPHQDVSTAHISSLEPCAYAYKVVCVDSKYTKATKVYSGANTTLNFLKAILEEQNEIQQILSVINPMDMTSEDLKAFTSATNCCICEHSFSINDKKSRERIVMHHCHLTGIYLGPAHNRCNVNCGQANFTPVIFHNLRGFDGHLLCQSLGHFKDMKIKCIAQNMEKYISFSLGSLRFIDSLQFMNSSLDKLVENLKLGDRKAFQYFYTDFPDPVHADLLLRKGIFPYQYIRSFDTLQETHLPPRSAFYSDLSQQCVSEEDYQHAVHVFQTLQLNTLDEYMQVYVKTDVSLLCCVFEQFRQVCLNQYKLDPAHFYSAPGLSWSAALKMTGVKLELMTDIDQVLFIENAIKGGISQVTHRRAVANNPYLGSDNYDSNMPTSYLMYMDMNNLYGYAMVQKLPVGHFRFLSDNELSHLDITQISVDGDTGYILEVSLEYPESIHDYTNCYPLCPEKRHVQDCELSPYTQQVWKKLHHSEHRDDFYPSRPKVEKLVCTLEDKNNYVVHFKTLQLYLQLGMKLKCIHRALAFHQEAFLKPYIDYNTACRKQAKNEFERNFYKGLNCSLFGKTLQNPRKFVDVKLVQTEKKLRKLSAKPSFKCFKLFNENLVGVECAYTKVNLCYPFDCGMTILDLSKHTMYDFFYNYLKPKYESRLQLQLTDTDSFIFYCETEDIYKDMGEDLHLFDTSGYPTDHPLFSEARKKHLGVIKDELNSVPMQECVSLRPKQYSYVYTKNQQTVNEKRCKGISRSVVKKDLTHELYRRTLEEATQLKSTMHSLQSKNHIMYCNRITKTGLSAFDDKRFWLNDGITSLAFGHYKIKQLLQKL